jgi:uncharacterized protein (TIGR00255 family)
MTQSMTGFARGSVTTPSFAVIVELRSVNNRFLDLHFRCPDNLRSEEPQWRTLIGKYVDRGKIEVAFRLQLEAGTEAISLNKAKLAQLSTALGEISETLPNAKQPDTLAILQIPGVANAEELDIAAVKEAAKNALKNALDELHEQRHAEGEKLAVMVASRAATMGELLVTLRSQLPLLREQQKQRLLSKLEQAGINPDASRLEEELIYVAQRSDVDEEMDRLDAHLGAITDALKSGKPCGRRLDFLMQELNREANTLSSKSTALTTTNTAVEFKVLIEQMREQIQNIE